ncbi:hypothetical protein QJQ45_024576, partial [Haematococcus lacustris]
MVRVAPDTLARYHAAPLADKPAVASLSIFGKSVVPTAAQQGRTRPGTTQPTAQPNSTLPSATFSTTPSKPSTTTTTPASTLTTPKPTSTLPSPKPTTSLPRTTTTQPPSPFPPTQPTTTLTLTTPSKPTTTLTPSKPTTTLPRTTTPLPRTTTTQPPSPFPPTQPTTTLTLTTPSKPTTTLTSSKPTSTLPHPATTQSPSTPTPPESLTLPSPLPPTLPAAAITPTQPTPTGTTTTPCVLITYVPAASALYLVHGSPGTLFKLANAPTFSLQQLGTLAAVPALRFSRDASVDYLTCSAPACQLAQVSTQSDVLSTVCPSLSGLSSARGIARSSLAPGFTFVAVANAVVAVSSGCSQTSVAGTAAEDSWNLALGSQVQGGDVASSSPIASFGNLGRVSHTSAPMICCAVHAIMGTSRFSQYACSVSSWPSACSAVRAGLTGSSGYQDGAGSSAFFRNLRGLVVDPLDNSLLTVDTGGCTLRKISLPSFTVTTFWGTQDNCGFSLGTATTSLLQPQSNLAVDASTGNVAFFSSISGVGSALALVVIDRASGLASSVVGLSSCVPGSASVDGLAAQACIPIVRDIAMADANTIYVAQPSMVRMGRHQRAALSRMGVTAHIGAEFAAWSLVTSSQTRDVRAHADVVSLHRVAVPRGQRRFASMLVRNDSARGGSANDTLRQAVSKASGGQRAPATLAAYRTQEKKLEALCALHPEEEWSLKNITCTAAAGMLHQLLKDFKANADSQEKKKKTMSNSTLRQVHAVLQAHYQQQLVLDPVLGQPPDLMTDPLYSQAYTNIHFAVTGGGK